MKILELRLKNLNSLYGEWFLDFTHPEYVSNGIFALTGPTGSGKSTILDALCLALYGATPRLDRITKSGNEIMSRQKGECFAEVLFQVQGRRLRCHWSQHRSRKKADGNLLEAKHEISDGETGKPIETKKSRVPKVVEEKTGMDFDRFTRSILLAQGGFDTFLKAEKEKKSKILEQITGTEIYSKISVMVHERRRTEEEKRSLLEAEFAGIPLLDPEEEKRLQQEWGDNEEREKTQAAGLKKIQEALAWIEGIERLEKEIQGLKEENQQWQQDQEEFQPRRERLARGLKAAEQEGEYAGITTLRQQQEEEGEALAREKTRLPALEAGARGAGEDLTQAEQQARQARQVLREAAPLIQEIRGLDAGLKEVLERLETLKEEGNQQDKLIQREEERRAGKEESRQKKEAEEKLVQEYFQTHTPDAFLAEELAGIKEQAERLLSLEGDLAGAAAAETRAAASLDLAAENGEKSQERQKNQQQAKQQAEISLNEEKQALDSLLKGRLLREYRQEKETLLREAAFRQRIAELEDHRAQLKEGSPCPLCGAEHHPYGEGNTPRPNSGRENKLTALSSLIEKAEHQETILKEKEGRVQQAQNQLSGAEKDAALAEEKKQGAAALLAKLKEDKEKHQADRGRLEQALLAKLQPLGIQEIPKEGPAGLLTTLQQRRETWKKHHSRQEEIKNDLLYLDSEIKQHTAVITSQRGTRENHRAGVEKAEREYQSMAGKRRERYGDKNPQEEEIRMNQALDAAEKRETLAREAQKTAEQALAAAKTKAEALAEKIQETAEKLKNRESRFFRRLQTSGFPQESAYREARLSREERQALTSAAKLLDEKGISLQAKQEDRQNRLTRAQQENITSSPREELESSEKALKESLETRRKVLAEQQSVLSANAAAKDRRKEKQALREAQTEECRRWDRLHGLIGSGDGKKYRNFAQGLTFEVMVSQANRQLIKMNGRYLLIRDEEQPLELNVMDNYQAGEIRSTKNLSGGESFLVSLALALGLSKMAGRRIRVDSLFLDEGFGTLDEEALETALETLSGLQQEGKLIGIISHISALKDRISTQISVTPLSGGRSTLAGPGCRRVSAGG